MGRMQEAKKMAEEIKQKLDAVTLTGEATGGDIRVEITGNRKVKKISISPALQHGDSAQLERVMTEAVNDAIQKADKASAEEMKKAAGGLLPGMF